MKLQLSIQGMQEFERLIDSMPKKLAAKGIRKAVKAAIKVVRETIFQRITGLRNSGILGRRSLKAAMMTSFQVRPPKRQRSGRYSMDAVFVDPEGAGLVYYPKGSATQLFYSGGALVKTTGSGTGRSFIPFALEYGHGSNKEQAARPFMRPGVAEAAPKAEKVLSDTIKTELDAIVREAGGQAT